MGCGESKRGFRCSLDELVLDKEQDKQWKQLGQDSMGLRLQIKFVRKSHGLKTGFCVADIRATIPTTGGGANGENDAQ